MYAYAYALDEARKDLCGGDEVCDEVRLFSLLFYIILVHTFVKESFSLFEVGMFRKD